MVNYTSLKACIPVTIINANTTWLSFVLEGSNPVSSVCGQYGMLSLQETYN
jgi:hypothetical protein